MLFAADAVNVLKHEHRVGWGVSYIQTQSKAKRQEKMQCSFFFFLTDFTALGIIAEIVLLVKAEM